MPRLIDVLRRHAVGATFLFSLGPDHTGRAIRRVFRPGFLTKVRRTSVTSHYGLQTLLYGTLLPGPDIGKKCADIMRQTRDEGFETGIHSWDHVGWQDKVHSADIGWVRSQLALAQERYFEIFKAPARTHGAAGWQMSRPAMRLEAEMGFDYCTDGRTSLAHAQTHFPVVDGEVMSCPQLPTDLPTLDELIGVGNLNANNVHEHLLDLTDPMKRKLLGQNDCDHVFTLHAELEGQRFMPVFENLLLGWKAQGFQLVSTRALFESQAKSSLPYFSTGQAVVPGRSGKLLAATGPWANPAQLQ